MSGFRERAIDAGLHLESEPMNQIIIGLSLFSDSKHDGERNRRYPDKENLKGHLPEDKIQN
jgi:hypothetical protein